MVDKKKEFTGINFKNISTHLTTEYKKDIINNKKKLSDTFKLSAKGEHHFRRIILGEFENKQVVKLLDKFKFWKSSNQNK